MTASFMRGYLNFQAANMNCKLKLGPSTPGMMYVECGYVEGPDPRLPFDHYGTKLPRLAAYMVCLHELGHYALDHTQGRPYATREGRHGNTWYFDNGILKSESEAWRWALAHSLFKDYDKATRAFMADSCLGSYMASAREGTPVHLGNGDRDYVDAVWDAVTPYVTHTQLLLKGEYAITPEALSV